MNRIVLISLALLMVALTACQDKSDNNDLLLQIEESQAEIEVLAERNAAIQTEFHLYGEVAATAAAEAEGLRLEPGNRIDELIDPLFGKAPAACPGLVVTSVRAQTGSNCDTYKAEIAGWANQCVTNANCDSATRLAEAVLSARYECKAFCDAKNCKGPTFQAPGQCATKSCNGSKSCPAACPQIDACFLLQQTRVWNCVCIEL